MSVANILSMAGGLGLFLFGIRTMGDGLENAAGAKLKRMLEVLTETASSQCSSALSSRQ